jgi:tRNA threonylcarbamoyladenosine biosynthesis protein TsaB
MASNDETLCLALETATATASVALLRGSVELGLRRGSDGQHHCETLLPMIDDLLVAEGLGLDDLDLFAVSIGPGAFTSLRIGLATLKGLAFGGDRPAVAVSTLEALALSAYRALPEPPVGYLVPALDARRGEVYAAAYRVGLGEPVIPASLYSAAELAEALPQGGCLVGEGAAVVGPALAAEPGAPWRSESRAPEVPDAVAVGLLGLAHFAAGQGRPAGELVPRYVRRAEAEVTRTAERLEAT